MAEKTKSEIVLEKIKKEYSEDMKKICRSVFPKLLEEHPEELFQIIKKHFPAKETANDLIYNDAIKNFKLYVTGKAKSLGLLKEEDEVKTDKTPEELLKEKGYTLIECNSIEDVERFKKYYRFDEELCTFHNPGDRLRNCHVFFAVKDNVANIKREDFINPERQDEYGTSVISIQFDRDSTNSLSIKNRYNHSVKNPDATFSNDLENIIPGLTYSFEKHKGLKEKFANGKFYNSGFTEIYDEKTKEYKILCVNYQTDRYVYCTGGYILDKFEFDEIIEDYTDTNRYMVIDSYILDLHNKKIFSLESNIKDGFLDVEKNIKNISVEKDKKIVNKTILDRETNKVRNVEYEESVGKKITITHDDNSVSVINVDFSNCIVGYSNESVKEIGNNFFIGAKRVRNLNLPNVEKVGISFVEQYDGFRVCLPSLKEAGPRFMKNATHTTSLEMQNLKK